MERIDYLESRPGIHLAYRGLPGRGPALIFLPGYASDMDGAKASALAAWAGAEGRAMLRFDYGGCGLSGGEFEAQSLSDWRDDVLAMIDRSPPGPVVLAGSSMGGWLMLLAALARPERVAGLVGIAAAPDFTAWGFSDAQKLTILREGRLEEPNPHGDKPHVTTRIFWESAEALRLTHSPIAIRCPVRLLHGQADPDVNFAWSLELARLLHSADVQTILVKDGDHRLSREADLALLVATVSRLMESL
ncbi:MAG TPA: alpha/beta hydrolase [Allosphingosinicella sp.]|nr:alpha/beta hydrolase [Allosphingosinicella sp.]